uniref:LITAF domain-containing protein n=1 Tax=Elaeophora elaphi TaxID=1147741 RepID=A0A0R3RKZ0_9BILA
MAPIHQPMHTSFPSFPSFPSPAPAESEGPIGVPGRPVAPVVPQLVQPSFPIQPSVPEYAPQAAGQPCSGCVININCGGRECAPTRPQPTIWTLPPITHVPLFTMGTPSPPSSTPGGCHVCTCFVPQTCQCCQCKPC